jgi:hypothetical protein
MNTTFDLFKHIKIDGVNRVDNELNGYDFTFDFTKLKLYKYCPDNDFTFDNLLNSQVMFNTAFNFNDPFDSNPVIPTKYVDNLEEYCLSRTLGPLSENAKMLLDTNGDNSFLRKFFRSNEYISSFSAFYDQPTMWSHYSSNYKGIVIEYSVDQILNSICSYQKELLEEIGVNRKNIEKENSELVILAPIQYDDEASSTGFKDLDYSIIDRWRSKEFNINEEIEKKDYQNIRKNNINRLYKKDVQWFYEGEWRISFPNYYALDELINQIESKVLIKATPKSVILGKSISTKDELLYINECVKQGIDIYKIRVDNNSYNRKLISEKIDYTKINALIYSNSLK